MGDNKLRITLTPVGVVRSEAVDGSSIIDIKPYVKSYYGPENPTVPEWMMQIYREVENV